MGRRTVARSLELAGQGRLVVVESAAELDLHVIAEVVTPEDAGSAGAAAVVLNKADLNGFGGDGPMAAAAGLCERFAGLLGAQVLPLSGRLAVAAFDDHLDWAALFALAAEPGGLASLDGSFDGFLTARLPVPPAARQRLLQTLDLFGISLAVTALRRGAGPAQVQGLLRRVSGVDEVIRAVEAAGAPARYQRVLDAVVELEVIAIGNAANPLGPAVTEFLASDDTVVARMAAALAAAATAGLDPGPAAPLRRAVHWQRYLRTSVSDLHRACGADVVRGSLRLAGGVTR